MNRMKQLLIWTTLVGALVCTLSAQATETIKTYLRGTVSGADGQSFTLYKQRSIRTPQAVAKVAGGRFTLEMGLSQPGFFVFATSDPVLKEFTVFLSPGDDITLAVENNQIVMRGKGSPLNQFLFDLARTHDYTAQSSAEEVYKARVLAINAATHKDVVRRKALLLGYAQGEFLDVVYGPFIQSKISGSSDEIKEPAFTGFDLVLHPDIVQYYNWNYTVAELLMAKMQAGKLKVRSMTSWVADFARAIDHPALREEYILAQLKHSVSVGDHVFIRELIKEAQPLVKTPKNVDRLKWIKGSIGRGADLYKNALPGTDLSAYTFLRPDSTQVAISDYKGKYVFIDIWATWCKPCVAEIPFLKRLEKQMHDQDIVFVSLSVDHNPQAWKRFMATRQMTGEQLIAKAANKDPFCLKIGLGGIPHFIILDKEGRMVNYNCSQRPSNPLLKLYLAELLSR